MVASPYARKLAREAGVDVARAKATGPGGRIVAADVKQLIESGGGAQLEAAASDAADAAAPAAPSAVRRHHMCRQQACHALLPSVCSVLMCMQGSGIITMLPAPSQLQSKCTRSSISYCAESHVSAPCACSACCKWP